MLEKGGWFLGETKDWSRRGRRQGECSLELFQHALDM